MILFTFFLKNVNNNVYLHYELCKKLMCTLSLWAAQGSSGTRWVLLWHLLLTILTLILKPTIIWYTLISSFMQMHGLSSNLYELGAHFSLWGCCKFKSKCDMQKKSQKIKTKQNKKPKIDIVSLRKLSGSFCHLITYVSLQPDYFICPAWRLENWRSISG